jgi:chitodextrinase
MRRSCGARAFMTCATAVFIVVSGAVPAGAQRLRSPASSLALATPSVTCGASPRVNLAWSDAAATAAGTYRVMSNTATGKANSWSAGAYLGNVRSTTVGAANGSSWKFAIEAKTSVTRDSNVQTITVDCPAIDTVAPSVPSRTSVVASSCSAVNLSWTAATDTGGSGLAGYNVWRDGSFVKRVSATSASDTGLLASTLYSYRVSALDNAGNQSARSSAATVTTPSCSNAAPVAKAGPDQAAQSLDLVAFDGSSSADSDGAIVSYVWTFGDQSGPPTEPPPLTRTCRRARTRSRSP